MLYKSNKVELHPKFARDYLYLQIIDENITFVEKKILAYAINLLDFLKNLSYFQ